VKSTDPQFRKTFLLQAMKRPALSDKQLVITNGKGRLFVQTLLPEEAAVKQFSGAELYRMTGATTRRTTKTGPAPECRVEISPPRARAVNYFLHV